jgi:hypothetical protein
MKRWLGKSLGGRKVVQSIGEKLECSQHKPRLDGTCICGRDPTGPTRRARRG